MIIRSSNFQEGEEVIEPFEGFSIRNCELFFDYSVPELDYNVISSFYLLETGPDLLCALYL
jgi:hypothetical protein